MKTNETLTILADQNFLDKIYQFSYHRCNTSFEAEDLCSDIILAVLSAIQKQESIENFLCVCVDDRPQGVCGLQPEKKRAAPGVLYRKR